MPRRGRAEPGAGPPDDPTAERARDRRRRPVWQCGPVPDLHADLRFRGLIHDVTDPAILGRLDTGHVTVYIGFDPSAASLHVGNLLQLVTLRRLQHAGHRPIASGRRGHRPDRGPRRQGRRAGTAARGRAGWVPGRHRRADGALLGLLPFGRGGPGAAARQRRLAAPDGPAPVPARRGQALHGQPDDGQGVGAVPIRARGPGDLLHRVQLHAAAGLRLPPAVRAPPLRAAAGRQRPVGQHHHGGRAHPQGTAPRRPSASPRRCW